MLNEDLLKEALQYFYPRLSSKTREEVKVQLTELAEVYRTHGKKRLVLAPFQKVNEPEEEYEARVQAAAHASRKRGRPALLHQIILLDNLRTLLKKHRCRYGVYKDGNVSNLVRLAEIVDLMAGKPKGDIDWQALGVKCADPIFMIETLTGVKSNLTKEEAKLFRLSLHGQNRKLNHK